MSDHVLESLDAYVANGLSADERAAVERHLAECADCAQAHSRARKLEQVLAGIFPDARPAADLETRAVAHLRRRPAAYPLWTRYLMGAAAVLVLALLGAIMQAVASDGLNSPFKSRSTFSTVGHKLGEAEPQTKAVNDLKQPGLGLALKDIDGDIAYNTERLDDVSVPGAMGRYGLLLGGARPAGTVDDSRSMKTDGGPKSVPRPSDFTSSMQWQSATESANAGGRSTGIVSNMRDSPKGGGGGAVLSIPEDELLPEINKPPSASYFKRGEIANNAPARTPPPPPPIPSPPTSANPATVLTVKERDADKKLEDAIQKIEEAQPPKEGPPPADLGRKIIRTGDMEFVTDSFDNSVRAIHRLIAGIKGKAFVATVNSDKLPNGKMRGAVVVRMEPIYLDKFIDDLRMEIGKTGDLKSQRVGSQDVTKQYTDVESELRAARAVEERFLRIIKDGKGEIKDLVAAERELGLWRTKIEKFEGEKRYYDSQVSLSTLTINLTEKEIETPAALVLSERVQMRVEVEDVDGALEKAQNAAHFLKGRVSKAESKQHKAGQREAVLIAEIPYAQRKAFADQLAKLGLVSENESTQKMQAEGGSGKPRDLKPRENDVVFEVTLNNIVNIQPRHSVTIDLAAQNVPAGYAKLHDAISRISKGQIRVANLNEPDKQRVTAVLDFNVPKEQKNAIDKLLGDIGPVLKKANVQAPVTEVASEQKFGYVVNLYSVATIPPRERVTLTLQVEDVGAKAAEIEELVKAGNGRAQRGEFNQSPGGQVSLVLVLQVPLSSSSSLVGQLMKGTKVVDRKQAPHPQAPDNELATSLIIVTVTGGSPIVPADEGMLEKLRRGLYWGFTVFAWSVILIFSGILLVGPWAMLIWGGVKLISWMGKAKRKSEPLVEVAAPMPEKPAS